MPVEKGLLHDEQPFFRGLPTGYQEDSLVLAGFSVAPPEPPDEPSFDPELDDESAEDPPPFPDDSPDFSPDDSDFDGDGFALSASAFAFAL